MTGKRDSPWSGGASYAVGRALAKAGDAEGLTAAEIAELSGKHQSNVKKVADELVEAGVLRLVPPESFNNGRGRRPQVAYAFAEDERERFSLVEAEKAPSGSVRPNTHFVFVERIQGSADLSETLSLASVSSGIEEAWAIEGDGISGLLFPFSGSDAAESSHNLLALLGDAEINARKGVVTKISSGRELRDAERRRLRLLERSRRERGEMRIAPRAED